VIYSAASTCDEQKGCELIGKTWTASPGFAVNGCLPGMLLKTYDKMSEERKKEIAGRRMNG